MRYSGSIAWFVVILALPTDSLGAEVVDTVEYPLRSWQLACGFLERCVRPNHLGVDGVDGDDGQVAPGTSVYAPAHGVVREARVHSGYGGTVIIEHDTGIEIFTSVIGHLRPGPLAVREGQDVRRGERIGEVGSRRENGGFTPHVHWGVRRGPYRSFAINCQGGRVWEWSYAGYPNCSASFDDWYNPEELVGREYLGADADEDGYTVSEGDCDDEDPEINPEAFDRCDGVDNDCSGAADEAFVEAGLFTPCSVGIGGCRATGTWICTAEGDGLFCTAPPVGIPRPEVCDGQDNDCNDIVDDGEAAASCDNGIFCDGEEVCTAGRCELGDPVACNDGVDCTIDLCWEPARSCSTVAAHERCDDGDPCTTDQCAPSGCRNEVTLDADGDGFISGGCADGTDCNDSNPAINPEAVEVCDGQDNDCNGEVDDELTTSAVCDNGIFCDGAEVCAGGACAPGEPIVCEDGIDCTVDRCSPRGCTHQADNSVCDDLDPCTDDWCTASGCRHPLSLDMDADRDGFYSATCSGGNDCNDSNPAINPEAEEICNEVDDNCDGEVDEEICDGEDNDCDGEVDEGAPDCWHPISTDRAPSVRSVQTAVWTGSEIIVWGGWNGREWMNTGGRYNPIINSWVATSLVSAPPTGYDHTATWTGSEMIVWGGSCGWTCELYSIGGRYDPRIDVWTAMPTAGAPLARHGHTATWTGSEMIIWGGLSGSGVHLNTGSRYNPIINSWAATSTVDAPLARDSNSVIWTGSEMIIWGGYGGAAVGQLDTGGRYDPISDSWVTITVVGAPSARAVHITVWTGSEMIVWGGCGNASGCAPHLNSGGRYDLEIDAWTPTSVIGPPSGRSAHTAAWTGSEMIVWGGNTASGLTASGGRYDPISDSWVAISTATAPAARVGSSSVWTGSEMIVWGGSTASGVTSTGGRYTPP